MDEPTGRPSRAEDRELHGLDYVKAALGWQYNVIGLTGAVAFAAVSGSGLPLILAAGLELIYLSLIPQNRRFQRLVRSWQFAKEKQQHAQKLGALFEELPSDLRTRYEQFARLCDRIRANYARLSSTSQLFVSQMDQTLDGLTQAYLRLLHAAHQHREYTKLTDPEEIKREVAQLTKKLESDSPKVREINRKRIEILTKRLDKFARIRENRQVIDAQCAAIEEVLELIRDQTVTIRDPQQISDHLSSLVQDVERTEETVRQVEAMFVEAMPGADLPAALEGRAPSPDGSPPASRTRTRRS